MKVLLDWISVLWGVRGRGRAREILLHPGLEPAVSALALLEVERAVEERERGEAASLLARLGVLPVGGEEARLAARYLRAAWAEGYRVDLVDAATAATALLGSLPLLTYNPHRFPQVCGMAPLILLPQEVLEEGGSIR